MKKNSIFLLLLLLFSNHIFSQKNVIKSSSYKTNKSEKEWKKELNSMQCFILRDGGTESPFSSPLNDNKEKGSYACAACKTVLYNSDNKYDSGSGWPSFDREIKGTIEYKLETDMGYKYYEIKCANCGGHLGHMFFDGPQDTTGKRHCVNGAALVFISDK